MKYVVRQRDLCRICGSSILKRFMHFDNMPLTDDFVSAQNVGREFLYPLDIYWCPQCKTAQTQHDVEVIEYYQEYGYTVSGSPFAQRFMQRLATETFSRFNMRAGDRIIEVGSGDGYQLSCFQKLGARVLGFEPSDDLTSISREKGVPVVQGLFTAEAVSVMPNEMRPCQVVLLTYTFDHLPDPVDFLSAVREMLDPQRGVLLIEVHDLEKIMERQETCLFAHEHSVYLSALTMKRLLERAGFKLLTTEVVPESERRGNSLLVAAALQESNYEPAPFIITDRLAAMEVWTAYCDFEEQVERSYKGLREHVRSLVSEGKHVAGYGVGGRGVMTLAMADLSNSDIRYVCDFNPSFHGQFTPGSHVPVVEPGRVLIELVDEVIVFSFGYFEEIKKQLTEYEKRGGQLISLLELL